MACKQDCRGRIGRTGEEIAARFLAGKGHDVLERNWRAGHLEIDVITEAEDGIHFVEVKSRVFPTEARPEENVGYGKVRKIVSAASRWLRQKGKENLECRFDVVSVVFDGEEYRIDYFPDAFVPVAGSGCVFL